MNKSDVSALIAYNFWADARIFAACEQITTEEFTRKIVPNPGWDSLRGILVHVLDAEYGWRMNLEARDASEILEGDKFANVMELRNRWNAEHVAWLESEAVLREEILKASRGNTLKVWQVIFHVVNHGTQHRGEAAAILTGYNHSPGEFDFDTFLSEHPEYGG
ncbi:MAG TPA: DinB family protein [Anaerolineales bacterium]